MKIMKSAALAAILALTAAAGAAKADITFSGSGSTGQLASSSESWVFNNDGGAAFTGYLNDWGSPGVAAGTTTYGESQTAYGLELTFSGGGAIDTPSIAIGNASACKGSTAGGTTFCNISSGLDIFEAFQTAPDTIEFLSQSPINNLNLGSSYFVNVFFDGDTPTAFTGAWLTSFTPTPPPVSAAPEPASWALMMAGVGLAGCALRTRRRFSGAALA